MASLAASWLSPDGSEFGEQPFRLMAFPFLSHALAQRPSLLACLTSGRAVLVFLHAVVARRPGVSGNPALLVQVAADGLILIAAARSSGQRPLASLSRHSLTSCASHVPLIH